MDGETKYKPMTEYYGKMLEKGKEFQDFITKALIHELGIPLSTYSSKEYQTNTGENVQGIEIKFDDRYKETGNIYIEVMEKSNPENERYVQSGIYRNDNTWLYLIGDYNEVFIFGKKTLQGMYRSGKYKEITTLTSIGFLVDKKSADKYCIKKLWF